MDSFGSVSLSPSLKDFISGAVAGAFAITVSQPLDTVRVRIQQAAVSGGQRNTLSVLVNLIRKEGVLSPFKGLTYPLLFASVQSAILFQAYGWTLRQLADQQQTEQQQQLAGEDAQPQHQHQNQQQHGTQLAHGPVQPHQRPASLTCQTQHQQQHRRLAANAPPSAATSPLSSGPPGPPLAGGPATHGSLPLAPGIHQLHLHHHHHALAEQQVSAIHGTHSVTGQVLAWATSHLSVLWVAPQGVTQSQQGPDLRGGPSQGSGLGTAAQALGGVVGSSAGQVDNPTAVEDRGVCGATCSSGSSGGGGSMSPRNGDQCAATASGLADKGTRQQQQREQQQPEGRATPLPMPRHGFVAGGVAGLAQVFLWSPVELLKLRAQLQTATPGSAGYRNPAALAAQVLRLDGVPGLYRGFTLTVIRDVPSYAMYFWLYHDIAGALSPGVHPEQAPPSTQVLAGGLAGVIAWLPIYPLDVLKTRVQAVTASASKGQGWAHYAREMYREGGSRAFFRGMAPTLVRAFMMDGASFLGYTTTLKLLGGGSEEGRDAAADVAAAGPQRTMVPAAGPQRTMVPAAGPAGA